LPRSYRELFDIKKQIDLELYVNGSDNIRGVSKAFSVWTEGFPSSVALVGEKGSGKSTLSNILRNEVFNETEVITIEISQSTWKIEQILSLFSSAFNISDVNRPEHIVNALNARKERIVVNLEGLQKLYLRNINGFDALEALWLIMSETKGKVFWITTCSRYAWEFLNKIEGIETHFTHVFVTDELSDTNIESVIMNRHNKSVYRLNFEVDESTRKSRNYKKRLDDPKAVQEYLKEVYFERLSDITEGNTSVASILWLRSIKKVEGRTITISPFQPVNIETLEILKSETLFTLAAIVLHDTLKVAELCRVLNLTLSQSRVLLTRLKARGVLIEEESGFYLNQLVYRQVLRLLKRRNIIH
jgi:ABC-type dipeptide/oligopeptide/nickel transport system ATPase subunit